MLQVSSWVRIVVAVVLLAGLLIALPNALPQSVLDKFPNWLPKNTVALGLDLQGGSYLLLEVDLDAVTKDKIESFEQRFARERTEFRARFAYDIQRLDARAAELRQKAALDAARRPELERGIQKLEQRSQELRTRLNRLDSTTSADWDQLKAPWQKKEGYEDYEDKILKETSM